MFGIWVENFCWKIKHEPQYAVDDAVFRLQNECYNSCCFFLFFFAFYSSFTLSIFISIIYNTYFKIHILKRYHTHTHTSIPHGTSVYIVFIFHFILCFSFYSLRLQLNTFDAWSMTNECWNSIYCYWSEMNAIYFRQFLCIFFFFKFSILWKNCATIHSFFY